MILLYYRGSWTSFMTLLITAILLNLISLPENNTYLV